MGNGFEVVERARPLPRLGRWSGRCLLLLALGNPWVVAQDRTAGFPSDGPPQSVAAMESRPRGGDGSDSSGSCTAKFRTSKISNSTSGGVIGATGAAAQWREDAAVSADATVGSSAAHEPPTLERPLTANPGLNPVVIEWVADPAEAETLEQKKEALKQQIATAYKGVFYDNDFRYIDDPLYDEHFLGDRFKRMHLRHGTWDVGGEQRVRYQNEDGMRGLGLKGFDDNFWLTRTRIFSNYQLNDDIRIYGEYIYADSGGENLAPRGLEENRSDALNLFADLRVYADDAQRWTVRGGRQEMLYGSQRLISPLDWSNTRRAFDGVKVLHSNAGWNIDGFWLRPVRVFPDDWDTPVANIEFYGAYGMRKQDSPLGKIDAYWLALDNHQRGDRIDTLGTWIRGEQDSVLWELESGVQMGLNADGSSHSAGAVTAGLGRKYELTGFSNTLWLYYDWASGSDTPTGGWNQYFPLAHKYLGYMDLFGRRNINTPNVQNTTQLTEHLSLILWYYFFFLDTLQQGPFTVIDTEYNPGGTQFDRDLGHELDVLFTYTLSPRKEMLFGYSLFDAGEYFSTARSAGNQPLFSGDAHFLYWQYQMRF
jgi:hypothetical protein